MVSAITKEVHDMQIDGGICVTVKPMNEKIHRKKLMISKLSDFSKKLPNIRAFFPNYILI